MSGLDAQHAPGSRHVLRVGGLSIVVGVRVSAVTALLLLLMLVASAVALTVGTLHVPLSAVPGAVLGISDDAMAVRAVQGVRLPRVLCAIGAGAALGVSGAIFQSLARNALGSPDVIGFTTGAATGALVMIVLFGAAPSQVAVGTIIGGVLAAAIVLLLARRGGGMGGRQLILVGIGVGATASALNGLLLVRGTIDASSQANLWLSGSLDGRAWHHALPVLAGILIVVPVTLACARAARLMELGDDIAGPLGVRVERTRLLLVCCAVVLAALATAAVGPIAFIALAAPQLVRRLTRSPALPVVGAASMGAALLVVADVVTQLLPVTFSVPIGRMTGVVGGLYLLWLLMPGKRSAPGRGGL